MIHTYHIHIDGQTRTPGFLSFITMLAERFHLNGFVNTHGGRLEVVLQGEATEKECFLSSLTEGTAPAEGNIRIAVTENDEDTLYSGFIALPGISPAPENRSIFPRTFSSPVSVPANGTPLHGESPEKDPLKEKKVLCSPQTPSPGIILRMETDFTTDGLLAFGSDLCGTIAWGHGCKITENTCGNLSEAGNRRFYMALSGEFLRSSPIALTCDSDPLAFSGRWASKWSSILNLPLIKVTSTHAQAALTMAENNLEDPVLAVCLDGAGDNDKNPAMKGGIADCSYTRFKWLEQFPPVLLPGGYRSLKQPWRLAVSCLYNKNNMVKNLPRDFVERIGKEKIRLLRQIIDRQLNSFPVTGITPLFAAVCSLLDICDDAPDYQDILVKLDLWSSDETDEIYPVHPSIPADWGDLLEAVLADFRCGVDKSRIIARFQNTLAHILTQAVYRQIQKTGWRKIILCGNLLRNTGFRNRLTLKLKQKGFDIYIPKCSSCPDGGIAAGRIAVAAHRIGNR